MLPHFGSSPNPALARLGNRRKAMVQSVEGSLKRLATDRIDLYFVHMDDRVTPVDEIARGLDDLVRAGKIVYAGLSNFPAWRAAAAARTADLRGWAPIEGPLVEGVAIIELPYRNVLIDSTSSGVIAPYALAGIPRHELGHTLSFFNRRVEAVHLTEGIG
ncbi:aldo/keto reductase [Sorangium sp. So ce1182]